ncbi:hypothetical protein TorRG33x02_226870 [Trema orientale]|uniref:Uncharacterized protein n=1 Tax=Trema orientale TaxID=63057 RepID=A0A2P5E7J1_TREOI|nr:hypothetical protein TorRG33x02_226870 [Trema orientale]
MACLIFGKFSETYLNRFSVLVKEKKNEKIDSAPGSRAVLEDFFRKFPCSQYCEYLGQNGRISEQTPTIFNVPKLDSLVMTLK